MAKAVIDLGSNSVLLLVQERDGSSWRTVFESSRVTGLGRDAKRSGRLAEDRIAATLEALRDCFREARQFGADQVIAAGTMALRIVENAPDFLARAEAQGTPVRVISGEEEADLGFLAVAEDPLAAKVPRISIIDPGGQSTELLTAERTHDGWRMFFRKSFPVGALGLREQTLSSESPSPADRMQALGEIDDLLSSVEYGPGEAGQAFVLGATGTNLISIRDGLLTWQPDRVHGAELEYEEVARCVGWMFDMDDAGRAAIPGIEKGREKTLHIGCLILERFMHAIHVDRCRVSVRGWRHALLEREFPAG